MTREDWKMVVCLGFFGIGILVGSFFTFAIMTIVKELSNG